MPSQFDQITQVYRALRTGILNDAGMSALMKNAAGTERIRNFPDLTEQKGAEQFSRAVPNDYPFIVLKQGAFAFLPFGANSRVVTIHQSFPIIISQKNLSLETTNNLNMAMLIALSRLNQNLGLPFVGTWDITGGNDTYENREATATLLRWVTLMQINVVINLDRQFLLASNP
jgi:hypothetical protein